MSEFDTEQNALILRLCREALEYPEAQRHDFIRDAADGDPKIMDRVLLLLADMEDPRRAGVADYVRVDASDFKDDTPRLLPQQPGDVIDKYRLVRILGSGGFGVVYLGEQIEGLERQVAIKIIFPDRASSQFIAQFNVERQSLARMSHPGIAGVYDSGLTANGLPYLVMEYIEGEPVVQFCDRHQLSIPDRLSLFRRICDAVQHAHSKGIIHRDLKPKNILAGYVDDGDGTPRLVCKVIDFGIVKTADGALARQGHDTLGPIGTLEYISPEQAVGDADTDARTDVYALGVLLYELLTSLRPLDLRHMLISRAQEIICDNEIPSLLRRLETAGRTIQSARIRRVDEPTYRRLLQGELDWICLRALEKEPGDRYRTASEFGHDIDRYLGNEPVEAGPRTRAYAFRKFAKRNKGPIAAAIVLLTVIIAGSVTSTIGFVQATAARELADQRATESSHRAIVGNATALLQTDPLLAMLLLRELPADQATVPEFRLLRLLEQVDMPIYAFTEGIGYADWSPDGRWLIAETSDGKVILWNAQTRSASLVGGLPEGNDRGMGLAWSPDSSMFAATRRGSSALVWNVETPEKPLVRLDPLSGSVDEHTWGHEVLWSPTSRYCVFHESHRDPKSRERSGQHHLCDTVSGTVRTFATGDTATLETISWHPEQDLLAVIMPEGVFVVDPEDPDLSLRMQTPELSYIAATDNSTRRGARLTWLPTGDLGLRVGVPHNPIDRSHGSLFEYQVFDSHTGTRRWSLPARHFKRGPYLISYMERTCIGFIDIDEPTTVALHDVQDGTHVTDLEHEMPIRDVLDFSGRAPGFAVTLDPHLLNPPDWDRLGVIVYYDSLTGDQFRHESGGWLGGGTVGLESKDPVTLRIPTYPIRSWRPHTDTTFESRAPEAIETSGQWISESGTRKTIEEASTSRLPISVHPDAVAATFEPNGNRVLLAVNETPSVLIADPMHGSVLQIDTALDQVHWIDWHPTNPEIAIANETAVEIWSIADPEPPKLIRTLADSAGPIRYKPDGNNLATTSATNGSAVQTWNSDFSKSSVLLHRNESPGPEHVVNVEWSTEGDHLVTSSRDEINVWIKETRLLSIRAQEYVIHDLLEVSASRIAYPPNVYLAQGGREVQLYPWAAEDYQVREEGHIRDIALSPDGLFLAVLASFSNLDVFSTDTVFSNGEANVEPIALQRPWVQDSSADLVVWSDDSSRIAVQVDDPIVWIRDEPDKPLVLKGSHGLVSSMEFNSDGTRLLRVSSDGDVQLWHLTWRDLRERLWQQLHAQLTVEERVEYLGEARRIAAARAAQDAEHLDNLNGSRAADFTPPRPPER